MVKGSNSTGLNKILKEVKNKLMLYSFFLTLIDSYSFFNVFKYLTVRTGLSMFTSMIVVFIVGSPFINYFENKFITL